MTIGVGKAYQRQGIAAALLQALVDEAKRQGASRMLLEVRVDNDPALALYQRFGFERMGLRKRYYQPEGIDAYTMSLDLKPRVVGFAAPQTASADIEDITSKQTENALTARGATRWDWVLNPPATKPQPPSYAAANCSPTSWPHPWRNTRDTAA